MRSKWNRSESEVKSKRIQIDIGHGTVRDATVLEQNAFSYVRMHHGNGFCTIQGHWIESLRILNVRESTFSDLSEFLCRGGHVERNGSVVVVFTSPSTTPLHQLLILAKPTICRHEC